jgi:hypothetical protein
MGTESAPHLLVRWSTQPENVPVALRPGYVGIDERSFADLLAQTVQFGRFVRFFNADDQEDGDWQPLLAADGSCILALLATLDVAGRSRAVDALVEAIEAQPDPERKERLVRRLLSTVFRLAAQIDGWLAPAEHLVGPGDRLVREMLEAIVLAELAPRLRRLVEIVAAAERAGLFDESIVVLVENFGPIWMIEVVEVIEIDPRFERDLERWLDAVLDEVSELIQGFIAGIASLADQAAAELGPSLQQSDHPPHIALLIAFITLYRHAQGRLNELPRRIADFYQSEILHEAPEPARPDRLFLAFTAAAPGGTPLPDVPARHAFAAGQDAAGAPVAFTADAALSVTGARPATLRLWQPVPDAGALAGLNALAIDVPADGTVGRPLLDPSGLPAASIGLMVAARMLSLESGRGRVRLSFIGVTIPPDVPAMAELLGEAFALSYSSTAGWTEVKAEADFDFGLDETSIRFTFDLVTGAPLTVCSVAGSNAPDLPAIRLMLNQSAATPDGTAALAVFGAMQCSRIRLEIWAGGVGDVTLATPSGPAVPGPGIAPFGSPALAGGTFTVSHLAFGLPSTTDIALALRWSGLPTQRWGFDDYYRQYVIGADRQLFVSGRLLDNSRFKVTPCPVGDAVELSLFQAPAAPPPGGGADVLPRSVPPTWLTCVLEPADTGATGDTASLAGTSWFSFPGRGGSSATGGSVALTLSAPDCAFGDSLYPLNVAYAIELAAPRRTSDHTRGGPGRRRWPVLRRLGAAPMRGLKAIGRVFRRHEAEEEESSAAEMRVRTDNQEDTVIFERPLWTTLPNPAWRPVLASLDVYYMAEREWGAGVTDDGSMVFYHLPPFDDAVQVPISASIGLLPELPPEPCFDLLIAGWPAGEDVSLLFIMGGSAGGDASLPRVDWHYRIGTEWIELPSDALLFDGTEGLSQTGIVTFQLPVGAGDIWLRASVQGTAEGFAPVDSIFADAVSATRALPRGTALLAPIPAGTITKASGLAGIAKVTQPLTSFGGAPAESVASLPARTSARLRHKDRGILAWDVERLVLESCSGIAKARVLPPDGDEPRAGDVLVTVIAAPGGATPPDPIRPLAPWALRRDVADILAARMSPFCRVRVVNPAYAALDIDAALLFSPGCDGPALLRSDLAGLLSPWAEPGLDIPGDPDVETLYAHVDRFIRSRPYVAGVERIATELIPPDPEQSSHGRWWMPVAGELRITAAAAGDLAAMC